MKPADMPSLRPDSQKRLLNVDEGEREEQEEQGEQEQQDGEPDDTRAERPTGAEGQLQQLPEPSSGLQIQGGAVSAGVSSGQTVQQEPMEHTLAVTQEGQERQREGEDEDQEECTSPTFLRRRKDNEVAASLLMGSSSGSASSINNYGPPSAREMERLLRACLISSQEFREISSALGHGQHQESITSPATTTTPVKRVLIDAVSPQLGRGTNPSLSTTPASALTPSPPVSLPTTARCSPEASLEDTAATTTAVVAKALSAAANSSTGTSSKSAHVRSGRRDLHHGVSRRILHTTTWTPSSAVEPELR